jgi:hypothetical protein
MHRAQDEILRLPPKEGLPLTEEERPEAETDGKENAEERKPEPAEIRTKPIREDDSQKSVPVFAAGVQSLEALFRHLHGKFGREELVIVLVMLLVSSDGASPELILLALLLIAG